ncbi:hypothetical protein MTO96_047677 [Rhipicephalus appendiculatus]
MWLDYRDDIGYFWHVSDFHVDRQYEAGGSRDLYCHRDANDSTVDNTGPYGDFLCDTPELLARSAVEAMERIKPEVDFCTLDWRQCGARKMANLD